MRKLSRTTERWALLWKTKTLRYLQGEPNGTTGTDLFKTRAEARKFANEMWGYIKWRQDLRAKPYCWRMPKPVRVRVVITEK